MIVVDVFYLACICGLDFAAVIVNVGCKARVKHAGILKGKD